MTLRIPRSTNHPGWVTARRDETDRDEGNFSMTTTETREQSREQSDERQQPRSGTGSTPARRAEGTAAARLQTEHGRTTISES